MADTTNYGWPLPDPQGNQQPEIQRIADALGLADEKVKDLADLISALAFNAIAGVIANAQLPERLRSPGALINDLPGKDFDLAVDSGFWRALSPGDTSNGPPDLGAWGGGTLVLNRNGVVIGQLSLGYAHPDGVGGLYYRGTIDGGSTWSDWRSVAFSDDVTVTVDAAVSDAIAGILDEAPSTLDTLNEIAAALGDDPNFATTIAAQLGGKLDATSYTAADVLAKLKTVDGPTSGIFAQHADDADKLGGSLASAYAKLSGAAFEDDVSVDGELSTTDLSVSGTFTATLDFSNALSGSVPVAHGGTGATTAGAARSNLGLGSLATKSSVNLASDVTGTLGNSSLSGNYSFGSLTLSGSLSAGSEIVTSSTAIYGTNNAGLIMASGGTAIWFRPAGRQSSDGQMRLSESGDLTIAGSATANGNPLAEVYTGSSASATSFPVGHTVFMSSTSELNRNSSLGVCISDQDSVRYVLGGSGSALSGTWRSRGKAASGSATYLAQRTA